jgi:hypothetical protein
MNKSIGVFVLNIATALYLLATGILDISGGRWFGGGEISTAVKSIFSGDFAKIVTIILAIIAIVAGVLILLRLFEIAVPSAELILIILAIVWVVFIIIVDIAPLFKGKTDFVDFLRDIGAHLMALGGIALATEKFGGR